MGVSRRTVESWIAKGSLTPTKAVDGKIVFNLEHIRDIPSIKEMIDSSWKSEMEVVPKRNFTSIELFAGAGGLALGFEKAGFHHVMLNELNREACETLRSNRPNWNVLEADIHNVDFSKWHNQIDLSLIHI